jgi:DNA repair protein RadD
VSLVLRSDQQASVDALRAHMRAGCRRAVLQAPTAWGKGEVIVAIVLMGIAKGRPWLVLAHLKEIVLDLAKRLRREGVEPSIIMGDQDHVVPGSLVTLATWQTLQARKVRPDADGVIVDECHRAVAEGYSEIAGWYPSAYHVGLSATPERGDGRGLEGAYDVLIPGPQIAELVELGILCPIDCVYPNEPTKHLSQDPVEAYPAGRPGIVFASSVPHSKAIAAGLNERGIRAAHCDADTDDRDGVLRRFAEDELDVLTNYRLFVEGVNAPRAEVCMQATRFSTPGAYLQSIGRVRRVAPGKACALLIDLRGNYHVHEDPDAPRTYHLEGAAIRKQEKLPPVSHCPACLVWHLPKRECPGPVGQRCGFIRPDAPLPKVSAQTMIEKRAALPEAERRAVLARFIEEALAKKHNPMAAYHRYRASYGELPLEWFNDALRARRAA